MNAHLTTILYVAAGLWAAAWLVSLLPKLALRRDRGGDEAVGLAVFVESIRGFGVRWGLRSVAAALRGGGFTGQFLYWPWHSPWRGWLVVPAIADARLLERQARRLADFLSAQSRARPHRPIYLIGYSCGGYVAARALELLEADVKVQGAALLAPAFSPWRDLTAAAGAVGGQLVIASSVNDWAIVGLGTLIVGTGDRKHVPSAGMIGLRSPAPANVVPVRWRLGMIRLGHLGGHFGVTSPRFLQRHVFPHVLGNMARATAQSPCGRGPGTA